MILHIPSKFVFTERDMCDVIPPNPTAVRLCSLALAALPVTYVSVERLFSAVRLLLRDLRSWLKQDAVEACSYSARA